MLVVLICASANCQSDCPYDDLTEGSGVLYIPHEDKYAVDFPEKIYDKSIAYNPCLRDPLVSNEYKSKISNMIACQYSRINQTDSITKYLLLSISYSPDQFCKMLRNEFERHDEIKKRFREYFVFESEELMDVVRRNVQC